MKTVPQFLASALAVLTLFQAGCESIRIGKGGNEAADIGASSPVPEEFLATDDADLKLALSQTYKVKFQYMRLPGVFEYSPIDTLDFAYENLPVTEKMFELQKDVISRRELLYEIAQFYDVDMKVSDKTIIVSGKPPTT